LAKFLVGGREVLLRKRLLGASRALMGELERRE